MSTKRALQLLTAGVLVLGVLGVAASVAPAVPFFWGGDDALLVGSGFLAIGVVMFSDLRRRNWGQSPPESV
jgi:hypothetical protein